MSARWHVVTGEYAPATGGIAQFTASLASALASRGLDVHVWTPDAAAGEQNGVSVHVLPDRFGRMSRRLLSRAWSDDDIVLVQYTPNAFGCRGANVAFCAWLAAAMHRGTDVRIVFHEPFLYFGRQSVTRNILALAHRLMAVILLARARVVYLSTESWRALLEPYAMGRRVVWQALPIAVGFNADRAYAEPSAVHARLGVDRKGQLVGYAGTYPKEIQCSLAGTIRAVLACCPRASVVCTGGSGAAFVSDNFAAEPRVLATGQLDESALPDVLLACDVVIAPFREGVTARRTSVIRALALGRAVVTTLGRYTEPLWAAAGAVALVPAGDPNALADACRLLLEDARGRADMGARARLLHAKCFSRDALLAELGLPAGAPAVLVGSHTYAAAGGAARRQRAAMASLAALKCAGQVSLQCAADATDFSLESIWLEQDSRRVARVSGPRKALTTEVLHALAARARLRGAKHFLFVNGDVRVAQEAVDFLAGGNRRAYLFSRTDVDAGDVNPRMLLSGIDGFAIEVEWFERHARRFRPYLVGESTWDNVYASILMCHADAMLVFRRGWLLHERHAPGREGSPYARYIQYLSALDAPYFSLWCEFHRRAVAAGPDADERALNAIAREVFVWDPSLPDRLVQAARSAKALVRYRNARRAMGT